VADKPTNPYANAKRASDYDTGIGDPLDKITGQEVALLRYSISERAMRGETKTFVEMFIDVNLDGTEKMYHAWSESLAEKLARIPTDDLPVLITFDRVATSGGFKVWTFE
jgi:hypothetical protein